MDFNRMLEEHEKIVPFKKIKSFFILMGIVGVIFILATIINSKMPNRDFYKVELSGRVMKLKADQEIPIFLLEAIGI